MKNTTQAIKNKDSDENQLEKLMTQAGLHVDMPNTRLEGYKLYINAVKTDKSYQKQPKSLWKEYLNQTMERFEMSSKKRIKYCYKT